MSTVDKFPAGGRVPRLLLILGGIVTLAGVLLLLTMLEGDSFEIMVVATATGLQFGLLTTLALALLADWRSSRAAWHAREQDWGPTFRKACHVRLQSEFIERVAIEREYGRCTEDWSRAIGQRFVWWTVAATFFALLGTLASLARITATRVANEGFLVLGGPALGSVLVATIVAACILRRCQNWQSLFVNWKHWAADLDHLESLTKSRSRKPQPTALKVPVTKPVPVFEETVLVQQPTVSVPLAKIEVPALTNVKEALESTPVWNPPLPAEDDNDVKG